MKIAWFTPFSTKSAIGKYSQVIVSELAREHEIHLWVSDTADLLATQQPVIAFSEEGAWQEALAGYDLCVYNLGNYLDFHKAIYEVSRRWAGVVILHDFVMNHFFVGYYYGKNEAEYVRTMGYYYGEDARRRAFESMKFRRKPLWETDEVAQYPMFEKALTGARGVIVHSQFFGQKVREKYLGPVGVLDLPSPFEAGQKDENHVTRNDLGIPRDRLFLLTLGHVNPNKRLDKTLLALGQDRELAQKIIYLVIGPHVHQEYSNLLHKLVRKYRLADTVKFLGYQSDKALYAHMKNADAFINLRFPIIEGASWSLVEQLYFGKPTVVTDAGFYSELPHDCVIKIAPAREVAELTAGLKRLALEPEYRRDMGARALAYAREHFNVKKYCREFGSVLREVEGAGPVLHLVDRVGGELSALHLAPGMEIGRAMAEKLAIFLGDSCT